MKGLSTVELMAVLFTGIAGLASAVQAYVSWETRGEVSRAIVFAQRIDACSKAMAAIEPFVAKARAEGRAIVASGQPGGNYSLPQYFYRMAAGSASFEAEHNPRVGAWRIAAAAYRIVSPAGAQEAVEDLDRAITVDIAEGRYMDQAEMLAWLEGLEANADRLTATCRGWV
ncbi:MAG: hypothetical protein GC150_12745 [Rhizobiales bacterium]|nr:hypothetical protein [Hyphomicrobiales bacterium]